MLVERLTVRHSEYLHLLTVGLRQVHLVVDATGRVEVKGVVHKSRALLVFGRVLIQQQGVVVGGLHGVCPHVVAVFQMLAHLFACQSQHEHQVLKPVELEHVALCHVACLNHAVESQRCVK